MIGRGKGWFVSYNLTNNIGVDIEYHKIMLLATFMVVNPYINDIFM